MPRPRSAVPAYRLHKPTGQAVVTVRTPDGGRRDVYLGAHGSEYSRAEYARVLKNLEHPATVTPTPAGQGVTVPPPWRTPATPGRPSGRSSCRMAGW